MSKRKQWKSTEKSAIILQGFQGRPVSAICLEYGLSHSQYYKWKDQFIRNMHLAYEVSDKERSMKMVVSENSRLKNFSCRFKFGAKKNRLVKRRKTSSKILMQDKELLPLIKEFKVVL